MKIRNQALEWAVFLLVAGVFLLLKNLGVFGEWGDVVWGGLFAIAGVAFLVWFILDAQQWWRVIPGFILLSIGALVLLDWRGVALGDWSGALVLFGIALSFWAVLLARGDNWWAAIPGGVLTVLGVLIGFRSRLSEVAWLAALFMGLGLVFVMLYFLRQGHRESRWAALPGAALLLAGITTLADSAINFQIVVRWWPVLLLAVGLGLLIGSLQRRTVPEPKVATKKPVRLPETSAADEAIMPPPLVPVETSPTEFVTMDTTNDDGTRIFESDMGPDEIDEEEVDIYDILARQPSEPEAGEGEDLEAEDPDEDRPLV